jgi:hypothetical protein
VSTVRVYFQDERIGSKFRRSTFRQGERVRESIRLAAQDASDEMVEKGNQNIAGAGNFGSRWQTLQAPVTEGGGNIRISLTHPIPYFMVHQKGATIRGKPLLWIPLPGAPVFPRGRGNTFFARSRKGNLLLFGKRGKEIIPLRVAKKSVKIPKRFRVIEIAREVANNIAEFYRRRWGNG